MTKPHGIYLAEQTKPKPVTARHNKKKLVVKNKTVTTSSQSKKQKPILETADSKIEASVLPTNVNLSANKLAKLLGRFMDLRSTIRGMSSSVKQVEEWLDSAYDMFEVAQSVTKRTKKPLNIKIKDTANDDDEIPVINIPKGPKTEAAAAASTLGSAAALLKYIDIDKVMKVVQSPLFTKAIRYVANRKKK